MRGRKFNTELTVFDWRDFHFFSPVSDKLGSAFFLDKSTHMVSRSRSSICRRIDTGSEPAQQAPIRLIPDAVIAGQENCRVHFPLQTQALPTEIKNSLPLQYSLLYCVVYGENSNSIALPNILDSSKFEHTISVLLKCYHSVHTQYKNGRLYAISVHQVLPYAKKVFLRLLKAEELHPCIVFLASRANSLPEPDIKQTLYEVNAADCGYSFVLDEVQEFAAFLKTRSELLDGVTSLLFYGYSFDEWSQNTAIQAILSQFSRSFYVEQASTKLSCGFYLLPYHTSNRSVPAF